ncbi:MAG: enoyl-CoA hydratase/isomerase family protein [Alphaproteobacteria bacterium]|nr:enoyl-CoA hydratase/isomerase family protein [Alphaproteobacteria bacterium]
MSIPSELTDLKLTRRGAALFITLDRPQAKNALTAEMVSGLSELADALIAETEVRVVVLRGAGATFCAGGDVKDFAKQMMAPDPAPGERDPVRDANRAFGTLLQKLDAIPQVFVSVVEGAAFGGAMGFLSVSDVVIAAEGARYSLSEATLGIPPAQIGPFVVRKIGLFNARRLALTGARFENDTALSVGLIDERVSAADIELALKNWLNDVGRCDPAAVAATKALMNRAAATIDDAQLDAAADDFVRCLRGQGRAGAMAFAARQAPPWVEDFSDD